MASGSDYRWRTFVQDFPAGLDTETDPRKLRDGFTPDGYGMTPIYPGRLVKGSAPSGTTAVMSTSTISGDVWTWYFRRLWRASGATLLYNSREYRDVVLYQGLGKLSFTEDTNNIVTFLPYGSNMYVGKSTGGYVVPGAMSMAGNYQHGDIIEALKLSTATHAIEMDGVVYVSNAHGLMALVETGVVPVTSKVLDTTALADFQGIPLTVDRQRRWVIGTDKFCYAADLKRLFRFGTSGFRYTTRTLIATNSTPFLVGGVLLVYENVGADQPDGELKYQIRIDREWEDEVTVQVPYDEGSRNIIHLPFETRERGREFTLRLTDLSPHLQVSRIDIKTALSFDTLTGVE